jgi:hypothetical protein
MLAASTVQDTLQDMNGHDSTILQIQTPAHIAPVIPVFMKAAEVTLKVEHERS